MKFIVASGFDFSGEVYVEEFQFDRFSGDGGVRSEPFCQKNLTDLFTEVEPAQYTRRLTVPSPSRSRTLCWLTLFSE